MQKFTVKTSHFEGPLELLLDLIEKRKLFINDISLAAVTDDYLAYLGERKEAGAPLSEIAHFIVIASTLLLIKSKSLLPSLSLTEEETESMEDLERRLRLYRRVKELAGEVESRWGKNILWGRSSVRPAEAVFAPPPTLSSASLASAIRDVLSQLPSLRLLPQALIEKVVSVEEMIASLTTRIQQSLSVSFKEFSGLGKAQKVDVIISFLAVLELVKRGIVNVLQEEPFKDFRIESDKVATPRYSN